MFRAVLFLTLATAALVAAQQPAVHRVASGVNHRKASAVAGAGVAGGVAGGVAVGAAAANPAEAAVHKAVNTYFANWNYDGKHFNAVAATQLYAAPPAWHEVLLQFAELRALRPSYAFTGTPSEIRRAYEEAVTKVYASVAKLEVVENRSKRAVQADPRNAASYTVSSEFQVTLTPRSSASAGKPVTGRVTLVLVQSGGEWKITVERLSFATVASSVASLRDKLLKKQK